MKLRSTPTCPKCPAGPRASEPYQTAFFVEDSGIKCGGCGYELNSRLFREYDVPAFVEPILKSMTMRNMMRISMVGANIGTTSGQISEGVSLSWDHRVERIGGCLSWFEIDYDSDFKPHKTDFAAIKKYAPLASAMIDEFLADGFVVSECPGKEGRRLRDAGIRLLKFVKVNEGTDEAPLYRRYKVRAYLLWNFNR